MQNIPQEYAILFNAITEAEEQLQQLRGKLMLAQQLAEEAYINAPQEEPQSP